MRVPCGPVGSKTSQRPLTDPSAGASSPLSSGAGQGGALGDYRATGPWYRRGRARASPSGSELTLNTRFKACFREADLASGSTSLIADHLIFRPEHRIRMSDIFISHAVADQALAKMLVDFLKEAIGVPEPAIFCSSVKGHHIPLGEDFNAYIKQQLQNPKLVILLMTPAYMESSFCLMELGAAWARNAASLAVVVPPISYHEVTKTLGLKQAWDITDKPGLVDFRELIVGIATWKNEQTILGMISAHIGVLHLRN